MSVAPLAATQTDAASPHQDALDEFVALSRRLARLVVDQAEAAILPAADASKAFDRVARSGRRCIWLTHKLAEPLKTTDRVAIRKRIIREVEDNIQRHADAREVESLHEELLDRMDAPDLEDEIYTRPAGDIITDMVRDFGLAHVPGNHPWKRRTPDDIALLRALAAMPPLNAVSVHAPSPLSCWGEPLGAPPQTPPEDGHPLDTS